MTEEQTAKVSKQSQQYRRARLMDPKKCGTCAMFRLPASCSYVAGPVRMRDVCNAYSATSAR